MTTAYIGDELLAQGADPFYTAPLPAPQELVSAPNAEYMIELTASFAQLSTASYLIDNNA